MLDVSFPIIGRGIMLCIMQSYCCRKYEGKVDTYTLYAGHMYPGREGVRAPGGPCREGVQAVPQYQEAPPGASGTQSLSSKSPNRLAKSIYNTS